MLSSLILSQGGVLGIQKQQLDKDKQSRVKLIPSENHLKRCATEIRFFCTLLSSGTTDPLCEDSLLVKLIQKTITLDIDQYRNNITRLRYNSVRKVAKRDVKLVFELWNETDLSDTPSSFNNLLARRLFTDLISYSPMKEKNESMLTLSSSSEILRSSLLLISSWITRFPNKKARWSRLLDYISTLVDIFTKNADKMKREHSENEIAKLSNMPKTSNNDFETCFSPIMVHSQTKSYPYCWVAYREAAASILISVVHANTKFDPPIDNSCIFDRKLCSRVSLKSIEFLS